MLDQLQRHAQQLEAYSELRRHANHATRLAIRKRAIAEQPLAGRVPARCDPLGSVSAADFSASDAPMLR